METKIERITKEMGHVIEIENSLTMLKMPQAIGEGYHKIETYLETQDAKMVDMPYVRYLDIDWEDQMSKGFFGNLIAAFRKKWHFQVGMQVSKPLEDSGELKASTIAPKKYLKTMHHGHYQKVGQTYRRMYDYAKEMRIDLEGESIEIYLNSPQEVKEPELETIVLIPIKS